MCRVVEFVDRSIALICSTSDVVDAETIRLHDSMRVDSDDTDVQIIAVHDKDEHALPFLVVVGMIGLDAVCSVPDAFASSSIATRIST